jgi:hypothetical protein
VQQEVSHKIFVHGLRNGTFYPLVPESGEGTGERRRDNAAKLRLSSLMERELPIEQDLQRWYPLWGAPL